MNLHSAIFVMYAYADYIYTVCISNISEVSILDKL